MERSQRVPIAADGRLSFPQPPNRHIAVDLDGYYAPSSVPLAPRTQSESSQSAQSGRFQTGSNAVVTGDKGTIYLDGSWWSPAGIVLSAPATNPYIIASMGAATSAAAFIVSNPSAELVRFRGDGSILTQPNTYYDGRTDFFGSPGTYWGSVPIISNVIHDVTLVNPRDAASSNASRVTFFKAYTAGENGSPAITKFYAHTDGYYGQDNANFHSTYNYHTNQMHFRAGSIMENKDTFWVKAATDVSSVQGHRADLYLSGRMGLGIAAPSERLEVANGYVYINSETSGLIVDAANLKRFGLIKSEGRGTELRYASGSAFKIRRITTGGDVRSNSAPAETTMTFGDGTVGIGLDSPNAAYKLHVGGHAHFDGNVTAGGTLAAKYQDVAEWVPSAADLQPGTVVVLDEALGNAVKASNKAYDSAVAGVVSAQPGLILGEGGSDKEQIATTGRVRVKVDATAAPIRVGDLLVTSGKSGRAMRSLPIDFQGIEMHRPGTIVGKALEPLAAGEGEILVLLSLQ